LPGKVTRGDFKFDVVADNQAEWVHPIFLGVLTAAEDRTTLKCEHVKSVQKGGEKMEKAIRPVFWALVGDFLVLAVNFIPAVGKWSLTFMAFYPF
jgi:hypothetical protein